MRIILVIIRALVALYSARKRILAAGPVRVKRIKVGDYGDTVTLRIGEDEPQISRFLPSTPEQVI